MNVLHIFISVMVVIIVLTGIKALLGALTLLIHLQMKFELTENEEKAAKEFIAKHRKSCIYPSGASPHCVYIFVPTGIGDICRIECSHCKEQVDITDYNCW